MVSMKKLLDPRAYLRRMKRLWIDFHLRFNKRFVCTASAGGHSIQFLVDSWPEYELRVVGSYLGEPSTLHWIEQVIQPEDCVYDVGANVGAYALLIAKRMKEKQRQGLVYAIEPEAGNFYKLNRNIQLNGLSQQIVPICAAVGAKDGIDQFHLNSLELGSACHALTIPISEGRSFISRHQQGIVTFSLDHFVQQKGMRFPNHIKIDVDGLEKDIVASAEDVLRDTRVQSLVIEINQLCSNGEVERIIHRCGFKELRRDTWKNGEVTTHNVLYVKNRLC